MPDFSWLAYGISHGFYAAYVPGIPDTPHYANDIGTPYHTPITALFSGTVVEQKTGIPWGTEIFIQPDDPNLPEYYYYHLDTLNTVVGQHLAAGQQIGLSGGQNSGGSNPTETTYSSGPHTHVGFFTNWIDVGHGIGTRGQGPDITPYVKALMQGQQVPQGNINTGSTGTPSSSSSSASNPLQGIGHLGQSIALGVVAIVLIGFGVYLLFQKQVDGLAKGGLKVATGGVA